MTDQITAQQTTSRRLLNAHLPSAPTPAPLPEAEPKAQFQVPVALRTRRDDDDDKAKGCCVRARRAYKQQHGEAVGSLCVIL